MDVILELLKAVLFGIVEGITEWLPISSTGHMILLDQLVKLQVSPEFYEMLYYSKNNLRVEKQEYEELVRNYLGKAFYGIYKIIS